jgi:hypothetical protein
MIRLQRTNFANKDFVKLVEFLDTDLKIRDGADHDFYDQFNKINGLQHVVIAYENKKSLGCGAFKMHPENTVEIKRM